MSRTTTPIWVIARPSVVTCVMAFSLLVGRVKCGSAERRRAVARLDGPEVGDRAVLDDVVGVVEVRGRRGVAGVQLDPVADAQRRIGRHAEAGVLLVDEDEL